MLKTTFANAEFANPFMNASGVHCMTTEDLEELKASQAGAYITKSSTLEKREGNPLPRYVDLEFCLLYTSYWGKIFSGFSRFLS